MSIGKYWSIDPSLFCSWLWFLSHSEMCHTKCYVYFSCFILYNAFYMHTLHGTSNSFHYQMQMTNTITDYCDIYFVRLLINSLVNKISENSHHKLIVTSSNALFSSIQWGFILWVEKLITGHVHMSFRYILKQFFHLSYTECEERTNMRLGCLFQCIYSRIPKCTHDCRRKQTHP